MKKPKASENKAKDVEIKRIDLPDDAKAEIRLMQQNLNTYLAGVVAGLGIKGKWTFDGKNILVQNK